MASKLHAGMLPLPARSAHTALAHRRGRPVWSGRASRRHPADQRAAQSLSLDRALGQSPGRAEVGRSERRRHRPRRHIGVGGGPLRRQSRYAARRLPVPVGQLRGLEAAAGAQVRCLGQARAELRPGLFIFPHKIYADREGNVWVVDLRSANERERKQYRTPPAAVTPSSSSARKARCCSRSASPAWRAIRPRA